MRFLADENFPGSLIKLLRVRNHDVFAVKDQMRGATDREVLSAATAQNRVILTFDKDFGELAVRLGVPASCGIVLFRLSSNGPEAIGTKVLAALESRADWAGHFSVISQDQIRMRPLPGGR